MDFPPLPNGRTSWLINGWGDPNYLRPSWDDPPSRVILGGGFLCVKTLQDSIRKNWCNFFGTFSPFLWENSVKQADPSQEIRKKT